MLDVFNTIVPSTANYQEFYYGTSDVNRRIQTWNKPRGASMVKILAIGAGGGGANGNSTRSTGGGSGVIINFLIPAMFVPDRLLIVVGAGGAGGAQGSGANSGSNGTETQILMNTSSGTPSQLFRATAGSGGTATGGTAGAATQASFTYLNLGIRTNIGGQAGGNANTAIIASTTTPLGGGAGGSSTTGGTGTSVTPLYSYPVVNGGATSGAKGEDGYFMTQPFLFGCGGAGGAGNASGVGGAGGNGGIGCGGGGGGAGSTAGGAGGNGGNGAVYIWAW